MNLQRFVIVEDDGDIYWRANGTWLDPQSYQVVLCHSEARANTIWYDLRKEAEMQAEKLNKESSAYCHVDELSIPADFWTREENSNNGNFETLR